MEYDVYDYLDYLDYLDVEQAQRAPMRTMPMVRRSHRLTKPVYRVLPEWDAQLQGYERDGMDDDMSRDYSNKNEYGSDHFDIDSIISEVLSEEQHYDVDPPVYRERAYSRPVERDEYEPEFDSRFSGTSRRSSAQQRDPQRYMDIEQDVPREMPQDAAPLKTRAADIEEEYEDDYDDRPLNGKAKQKRTFGKKAKAKTGYRPRNIVQRESEDEEEVFARSFRDATGELRGYADAQDYTDDDEEYFDDGHTADYMPPSFSEYVASVVASVVFRIKGTHHGVTSATMTDEGEDENLGEEVSFEKATKYYDSHIRPLGMRLKIAVVLLGVMTYISLGLPVPGMLGYLPVTAAMCLAIQLTIMLLALDIVTTGVLKLAHLKMGADSLAVIACLITSIDATMVALDGAGSSHVPLCAVSSLSLMGVMLSSYLSVRALRKSFRTPTISKRVYSVVSESGVRGVGGDEVTILRSDRPANGFVHRCEEAAPDETLFAKLCPFLLLAAMVLTIVVSAATRNYYDVIFIFSALLCPAIPFAALLCFAMPFYYGAMKMFSDGAAVAGWSGVCDIGQSDSLIVIDRDLFPDGTVSVEGIQIFGDEDINRMISYAGSMIIASGSAMSSAFSREMETHNIPTCHMDNIKYLSGGGMEALIDGHVVLCGSSDLMRLMNVKFPSRLVDMTTVLLAVDGIICGIFHLKYEANDRVRKALSELMRSNRHPIFAMRDFCITPEMLGYTFDIATDGYDFPPYVERFKITDAKPSEDNKIAAVVGLDGLKAVTSMADTGKKIYNATTVNLLIAVLSAALGILAVCIRMLSTGSIGVGFVLKYMLLTALPVIAVSLAVKFR